MKKDAAQSSENLQKFIVKHGGRLSECDRKKVLSIDDNSMDEDNEEKKQGSKLYVANQ